MATTTTNFGWDIPQSTDLVKDGATAIAALGQDIDTALVDLKGGTTGQVLAKASGTDLDYSWTTPQIGDITAVTAGTGISGGGTGGDVTVTNSMATAIDAKGDLIGGTGADTFARLAVGTNDQVLTADSTAATGLKWATPTSDFVRITTQSFTTSSAVNVNDVFSSAYKNYQVYINVNASTGVGLLYRYRVSGADNSSSNYAYQRLIINNTTFNNTRETAQTNGSLGDSNTVNSNLECTFFNPFESKLTYVQASTVTEASVPSVQFWYNGFNATTSFTGFTLYPSSGTITGSITVYGMKG